MSQNIIALIDLGFWLCGCLFVVSLSYESTRIAVHMHWSQQQLERFNFSLNHV